MIGLTAQATALFLGAVTAGVWFLLPGGHPRRESRRSTRAILELTVYCRGKWKRRK